MLGYSTRILPLKSPTVLGAAILAIYALLTLV